MRLPVLTMHPGVGHVLVTAAHHRRIAPQVAWEPDREQTIATRNATAEEGVIQPRESRWIDPAAANVSWASFRLRKATAADIERTWDHRPRDHARVRRIAALHGDYGLASPIDGEGAAMPCSRLAGGSMPAVSSVAIQSRTPIWPVLVAPLVSGVYYLAVKSAVGQSIGWVLIDQNLMMGLPAIGARRCH